MEETRARRKNKDAKRARCFDGRCSKNSLKIQDNPRFKKRFSNKVPSEFPKSLYDKVSKPRDQNERNGNSPNEKPTCAKCVKGNLDKCLV